MRLKAAMLTAASALAIAAVPAAAQNTTDPAAPPPPAEVPAPPPPAPPPPPPPAEPAPVVVVPSAQPPARVTIDPDAAYPNGFADPADPFGNDMSLAYRRDEGFPWGLLGLLGLLGLVPLLRERGRVTRTVYVERDDRAPPGRVIREERIEPDERK